MTLITSFTVVLLLLVSCGSNNAKTEEPKSTQPLKPTSEIIKDVEKIEETPVVKKDYTPLIFNVQLGISKQRPNWVLFENGTYILFKEGGTDSRMTANSKDLLRKAIDTSNTKNIAGTVKKSQLAKGWIVTFENSGLYNYVDHKTLPEGVNSKATILEKARLNLAMDYNDLVVVKVHK